MSVIGQLTDKNKIDIRKNKTKMEVEAKIKMKYEKKLKN